MNPAAHMDLKRVRSEESLTFLSPGSHWRSHQIDKFSYDVFVPIGDPISTNRCH